MRDLRPLPRRHRRDVGDQGPPRTRRTTAFRPAASPGRAGARSRSLTAPRSARTSAGWPTSRPAPAPRACCGRSRNNPSTLFRLSTTARTWSRTRPTAGATASPCATPTGGRAGRRRRDARRRRRERGLRRPPSATTDGPNSATSRPAVLRYDVSSAAAGLNATNDWNLTSSLPGDGPTPASRPSPGCRTRCSSRRASWTRHRPTYNPADYPNHGPGLFFVGVEQDGRILAYALDQTSNTAHAGGEIGIPFRTSWTSVRARDHPPVGGVRQQLQRPQQDAGHRAVGPERREVRRHQHLRASRRHAEPQQRGLRHRAPGRVRRRLQAGHLDRRQQHRRRTRCARARSTARVPPPQRGAPPRRRRHRTASGTAPPPAGAARPAGRAARTAAPRLTIALKLTRAFRRTGKFGLRITLGERAT